MSPAEFQGVFELIVGRQQKWLTALLTDVFRALLTDGGDMSASVSTAEFQGVFELIVDRCVSGKCLQ